MTASLLNLLGQIPPVLRNLSGLPLLVFVLLPGFFARVMDEKWDW